MIKIRPTARRPTTVTTTTSVIIATSSQTVGQPWLAAYPASKQSSRNSLNSSAQPAMTKAAATAISIASSATIEAVLP